MSYTKKNVKSKLILDMSNVYRQLSSKYTEYRGP